MDVMRLLHHMLTQVRFIQQISTFKYADITYTAPEMAASMQLFLDIIEKHDGEQQVSEIQREIEQNFLFLA